jgi:hypothetical protein
VAKTTYSLICLWFALARQDKQQENRVLAVRGEAGLGGFGWFSRILAGDFGGIC